VSYRIRFATSTNDLERCFELRAEAEAWLAAAGIDQWTDPQVGREAIREAYDDGTLYVVTDGAGDAEIVACCSLGGPDADFWHPWEQVQPALYLYKLIITRAHAGKGLGDAILDWACHRAHQVGAKWLRLDCWRDNTSLQVHYLARGFTHVDTRTAPGRSSGWLAQRDVHSRFGDFTTVLVDETFLVPGGPRSFIPGAAHRYDPYGAAGIWQAAANTIADLRTPNPPRSPTAWNDALEQGSRVLEGHGGELRRFEGMFNGSLLERDAK
jgi:GNAT superfamily N-acetyltransferase